MNQQQLQDLHQIAQAGTAIVYLLMLLCGLTVIAILERRNPSSFTRAMAIVVVFIGVIGAWWALEA